MDGSPSIDDTTTNVVPVTPDSTIAELLATCPGAARVLVRHHMHCVGCAIATFETVAEACAVYGIGVDVLLAEMQRLDAQEETK